MGFWADLRDFRRDRADREARRRAESEAVQVGEGQPRLAHLQAEAADAQRLMAGGRVGRATVTALRDTGVTINENPEVELELCVEVEGGDPYPVTHRQIISRLVTGNFRPGASVSVRVDPADPQRLIIA
jgi:hypothetical protein